MKFPWRKAIVPEFIPTAVGEQVKKGTCLEVEGDEYGLLSNVIIADESGIVIWTGDHKAFASLIRNAARESNKKAQA